MSDKKRKPTVRRSNNNSKLPKGELKEFRVLLTSLKQRLKGDVDRLGNDALHADSGELSTMPIHMADVGSDTFEQDMTLGRLESESEDLGQIEAALGRIEKGSYGLCENCEQPIPKGRLRAIPYARLCIPCKQKEETVS